MEATRLYLLRHGQVIGFQERRYNGQTDVDLTALGRAQLEAAAEDLAAVDLAAVYTSDLKRARYGGELLAKARGLELRVEPELREIFFGDWEGLSTQEIEERYPGALARRFQDFADHRPPGGETIREMWRRVERRMSQILAEHKGRGLALVAHAGVNRAIVLQALGAGPELIWRLEQDFACLNIIEYFAGGSPVVKLANGPNRVGNGFQGI
ncbi:MAG: histidine phosphatase family protein [Thermodesulfobacteriota bacterium]